jgi:citrate lyase beta subunit
MREPVHVVYGGAHLFRADTCAKLGRIALKSLDEHAGAGAVLAGALGIPDALAGVVYERVRTKLEREPVEAFHIDFEDGFGVRSGAEEDAAALRAASEVAAGMESGTLPVFPGIRIKPLNPEWRSRALRTLRLFLDHLKLKIPQNFVVVLPKVTGPEQIVELIRELEPQVGIEIMIETPQALLMLPQIVKAAGSRCRAAHFGAYDYTSALGITAASQSLLHPACDFARSMMQLHLAGTGIRLSDGATNVLPLSTSRDEVHQAWKLHYDGIHHALERGFYQGWDLHPAQLPARFAALYAFFLGSLEGATARFRNFIEKAAQASEISGVFDDMATGLGLLNYFQRAVSCGAIPESTALPLVNAFSKISERPKKLE